MLTLRRSSPTPLTVSLSDCSDVVLYFSIPHALLLFVQLLSAMLAPAERIAARLGPNAAQLRRWRASGDPRTQPRSGIAAWCLPTARVASTRAYSAWVTELP